MQMFNKMVACSLFVLATAGCAQLHAADAAVNPFTGETLVDNAELTHKGTLKMDGTTPVISGRNGKNVPVSAADAEVAKKLNDMLKLECKVVVMGKLEGSVFKISSVEQLDDDNDKNDKNDRNDEDGKRMKKGKKGKK